MGCGWGWTNYNHRGAFRPIKEDRLVDCALNPAGDEPGDPEVGDSGTTALLRRCDREQPDSIGNLAPA